MNFATEVAERVVVAWVKFLPQFLVWFPRLLVQDVVGRLCSVWCFCGRGPGAMGDHRKSTFSRRREYRPFVPRCAICPSNRLE